MKIKFEEQKESIKASKTAMGIEFGSTRIKTVLIDEFHNVLAKGEYAWESQVVDLFWSYTIDEVWHGLQQCYQMMKDEIFCTYHVQLNQIGSIGISGMMHGYMVFDKNEELIVPFRTWRNSHTYESALMLTELFQFKIPNRWTIAHLFDAVIKNEEHVRDIDFISTLSGYVHWKLTGMKTVGIGEASGMFPLDHQTCDFNNRMIKIFNQELHSRNIQIKLDNILPRVLSVGEQAGLLTVQGSLLIDPSGELKSGIPFCPAEGDACTGMIATNSIRPLTGNVSVGTSIFASIVLVKEMSKIHPEIDIIRSPVGNPVAMVHCNNGTSEINEWINMFAELLSINGIKTSKNDLYNTLINYSLKGDKDSGNLLTYNYFSGEHITNIQDGVPLTARPMGSKLNLSNFMKSQLYAMLATLKIGVDVLFNEEHIELDSVFAHGGFFKTTGTSQKYLAAALNSKVIVSTNATEGGPWGMAILAQYMKNKDIDESIEAYLSHKVFVHDDLTMVTPDEALVSEIEHYVTRFKKGLPLECLANKYLK